MLNLPHDTGRGGKRYFAAGHWMNWVELRGILWRKDGLMLAAQCIVAVTDDERIGCSKAEPCVHAFHLRPNTSGEGARNR